MVKRFEAPKPICIQARRLLETKLMVGLVTARTVRATTEYILEIILKLRPHGQAVKTPPFHGGIPGSNPGGVTKSKPLRLTEEARPKSAKYRRTKSEDFKTCSAFRKYSSVGRASALQAGGHRFEPCYFHQYHHGLF